ncbi:hypothetical protein PFLUV_G00218290 [Perca fluviatilis]|uniref:LBH domain-containing protein n=1 Tax=Perca fluviatilis TaxID=8168 RepID=A0A6A5DT72_PERFL|nr:hypothetical protein PFLUV_G00218290 [Perca fluviatilis]
MQGPSPCLEREDRGEPEHGGASENVSRCVPSIVVEPTVGGQVESGELRWPPDDVTEGQVTGVPVEEAEPEEPTVGGV